MLRGRHRGLPIAIDRAVLLPSDLEKHGDDTMTISSNETARGDVGRRTRTSFSSHTAVTAGGLQAVEPMTDEIRLERLHRVPNEPSGATSRDVQPNVDEASSPTDSKGSAADSTDPTRS